MASRWLRAPVVLCGALLLASCGAQTPDSSRNATTSTTVDVFQQQRTDGVTALLHRLDRALLRGTPADLAAIVDPAASPEFRRSLQVMQDNLSSITPRTDAEARQPLRYKTFEHYVGAADAEELVPDAVAAKLTAQGSSDSWVSPVRLRFALGGVGVPGLDESPIDIEAPLVVARYDDRWTLVGDLEVLHRPPNGAGLWSFPGVRATAAPTGTGQSVVASYPGAAEMAARLVALLPAAVRAVTAFWGDRWPQRALVIATGSDQEFAALAVSGGADVSAAAAATVYTTLDVPNHAVTGQRIVFTPAASRLATPLLAVVLRHELSHVAVRLATKPDAPQWLTEGVAEYVGRKGTYVRFEDVAPDLAVTTRTGAAPAWPTDQDFAVDSQRASLAYQSAWSIAAFVAQRYSEDALRKLYLGVAGAADDAAAAAAIRDAVGVPQPELERQWRAWVRKQTGG
ncbi:hypothetical protein GCM10010528_18080 [Gordonia defluvii]|uniref:Peptidase MA-like domain-containing protein n=1 Tax=Gordonia defluvii TaxID=283718 RepID=A0ABP6LER6_9ACTN|nr:hypothetical protein [Gordonia sp. UBA5067]